MIDDALFDALNCGARTAVKAAWDDARVAIGTPDEVDHIYAMTTEGIKQLGALWSPVLKPHGIALRVTGVFCHQTPKAKYKHPTDGPKEPELGDLLVVHEHTDASLGAPRVTRRAVLIQAKMAKRGVPPSRAVDRDQEYLYEHWPEFELNGRGPLGGARFSSGSRILGAHAHSGYYGLIEMDPHTATHSLAFPWTFSEPYKPIRTAGGEDAGAFIANMLYDSRWQRGRHALIPASLALSTGMQPNNHFDVTVEELLTVTACKLLRFKNKLHVIGPRGTSVVAYVQVGDSDSLLFHGTGALFAANLDGDGAAPADPADPAEAEFNDGISLVLIETGSRPR
jgi:hypothetical protein